MRASTLFAHYRKATLSWSPESIKATATRVNAARVWLPFNIRYAMRASRVLELGITA
jgi:hypothetical protein